MNCVLWLFYGIPTVHPNNTLVVTTNGFGLFIELLYLAILFYYTTKRNRRIIPLFLLAEAVAFAAIAGPTLLAAHTHEERSMIVGTACVVFGIVMYGSPMSVVWKIFETKSTAEFLPVYRYLCLVGFVNSLVWFAYAFLGKKTDPYIAIPNGTGAVLGFIQLCMYCYYTFHGKPMQQLKDKSV